MERIKGGRKDRRRLEPRKEGRRIGERSRGVKTLGGSRKGRN